MVMARPSLKVDSGSNLDRMPTHLGKGIDYNIWYRSSMTHCQSSKSFSKLMSSVGYCTGKKAPTTP